MCAPLVIYEYLQQPEENILSHFLKDLHLCLFAQQKEEEYDIKLHAIRMEVLK